MCLYPSHSHASDGHSHNVQGCEALDDWSQSDCSWGCGLHAQVEAAYTPTCVAISNAGDLLVVGGKDKKTYFYKVGADGALTADGSSDATTGTFFSPPCPTQYCTSFTAQR